MKIAVACDGLNVSSHAARCESFTCYTVEKGIITDCRNLPNTSGTSLEAAHVITALGFDAIIAQGIDMDMADVLCASGVEVVAGASGTAREVAQAYISNTLLGTGAIALCHIHEQDDPEDDDIEDAFNRIAQQFERAIG